jgi:hypothetical protein
LFVARKCWFVLWRDGVDVVGCRNKWNVKLKLVGSPKEIEHDFACPTTAVSFGSFV